MGLSLRQLYSRCTQASDGSIDKTSDRILGFTAFGAEASELMAVVQTAMLGELPFTTLRDALFTHPTAAEGLTVLLADAGLQNP